MKTQITVRNLFVTSALVLSALQTAHAGNREGNGGGAWVCGNADGSIARAELLDLREAEQRGLMVERTNLISHDVQLKFALKKLAAVDPALVARMQKVLDNLKEVPAPENMVLAPPADTGLKFLHGEANCSLQGVANYDDGLNQLDYSSDIKEAMSETDIAALYFHEALYKVQRDSIPVTISSTAARNLTGAVFSSSPLQVASPREGSENASFSCVAENRAAEETYHFYIIPMNNGQSRVQFTRIAGMKLTEAATFETTTKDRVSQSIEEGFQSQVRLMKPTDSVKEYKSTFRTSSEFVPVLDLNVIVGDNSFKGERHAKHEWAWAPIHFERNYDAQIVIRGDVSLASYGFIRCTPKR